jgi:hypothetical protein
MGNPSSFASGVRLPSSLQLPKGAAIYIASEAKLPSTAIDDQSRRVAGNLKSHPRGRARMQLDVMQGAWVSDMLLDAGRRILSS